MARPKSQVAEGMGGEGWGGVGGGVGWGVGVDTHTDSATSVLPPGPQSYTCARAG